METCERVEQTKLHIQGEQKGNCFQAVLAGLLKLPIETIPMFETRDGKLWQQQLNEWLRQFGIAWFPLDGDDLASECKIYGIEGLWAEIAGTSPRGTRAGHSCAALDGKLAWDPHPSQAGLEKPMYYHGVFIALRPWEMVASQIQRQFLAD